MISNNKQYQEEEDALKYYEKMANFRNTEDHKNICASFKSQYGKSLEKIIFNYFKSKMGLNDETAMSNTSFTCIELKYNLCETEEGCYDKIKANLPKFFPQTESDNTDEHRKLNSAGSSSENTKKKVTTGKKVEENDEFTNSRKQKPLEFLKKKVKGTLIELEVDAYFLVKGKHYKNARNIFYFNESEETEIDDEQEYEIFMEIGTNFSNEKFRQLRKLSALLIGLKNRFPNKEYILQLVFNSSLKKFVETNSKNNNFIKSISEILSSSHIKLFINYVNLLTCASLHIYDYEESIEKVRQVMREVEKKSLMMKEDFEKKSLILKEGFEKEIFSLRNENERLNNRMDELYKIINNNNLK